MIDHLVYAVNDLDVSLAELSSRFGVSATPGGRHLGWGTRNELFSLGACYLEVVGPDLDDPRDVMPFGIEALSHPTLVAWCARPIRGIAAIVDDARRAGVVLGPVRAMARERLDGVRLAWELTMPQMIPGQIAPMPFFIDWGATPHPTTSLPPALELLQLRVGHPDPEWLSTTLADLGELDAVEVVEAAHVSLSAVIRTPDGSLVLS